ncbi:MAG: hypothetical protein V1816_15690 [Pseudomonadota bacterium]
MGPSGINPPALLRLEPVRAILRAAAPGPVFLVGGSVRDLLLDRDINDLDLVVPGDLEQVARHAAEILRVRAVPLGRDPKRIFRLTHQGLVLDLCPLEGPDIVSDLLRRDLTINAMALELQAENCRLLDPTGGAADLEARVARFVSEKNILNDPLRLLRLFRFAATLGLEPDPAGLDLVRKHAALIVRPAGERLHDELMKLFSQPFCFAAVQSMLEVGLLEALLPELSPLRGRDQGRFHHLDVLDHTMLALERLETIMAAPDDFLPGRGAELKEYLDRGPVRAWLKSAVLFHDLGKPATWTRTPEGEIHFLGHEKKSADLALGILSRLRASSAEQGFIRSMIENHLRPFHLHEARRAGTLTPRGVFRLGRLMGADINGLLIHALADSQASLGPGSLARGGPAEHAAFFVELLDETRRQLLVLEKEPRLLNGSELMTAFHLGPSPLLRRLLEAVEEAQALGKVKNKTEALDLAEKMLSPREAGD